MTDDYSREERLSIKIESGISEANAIEQYKHEMEEAERLRKHIPLVQASKRLGKHKLWLNQIARGEVQEPKFSDGIRLLDFACDRIGKDRLRELG